MKLFLLALAFLSTTSYANVVETMVGPRATGLLGLGPNPVYYTGVLETEDLPESFDWRSAGVVTPVRDQGQCGSCVSFGATKAFEAALMIQGGMPEYNLSEQEMLSCRRGNDAFGCNGAYMTAPGYMADKGQGLEVDFPYVARQVRCKQIDKVAKASSYQLLGARGRSPTKEEIKAALVKYGPLVVDVRAGGSGWSGRTGQVTTCRRTRSTNHVVTLVGYDSTGWIFRNSWGTRWGNKGDSKIGFGCDGFASSAGFYTIN